MVSSAFLFGLVHITNPGGTLWASIAIAIEAGLLLGAAYKWSGTLWLPIGIHWAWNFSQGNLFGFLVSGQEAGESLLQAQIDGADWLTGGAFGAEASVVAVVVGLAVSVWLIWRIYRK
jgi:membrane protease YdiL (CAAX protease family)